MNPQNQRNEYYKRDHAEQCWLGSVVAYDCDSGRPRAMFHEVYRWRFGSSATAARWLREELGWVSVPRFQNGGTLKNIYCRIQFYKTDKEYLEVMQMDKGNYPRGTENYEYIEEFGLDENPNPQLTYNEHEAYILQNYASVLALYGA